MLKITIYMFPLQSVSAASDVMLCVCGGLACAVISAGTSRLPVEPQKKLRPTQAELLLDLLLGLSQLHSSAGGGLKLEQPQPH